MKTLFTSLLILCGLASGQSNPSVMTSENKPLTEAAKPAAPHITEAQKLAHARAIARLNLTQARLMQAQKEADEAMAVMKSLQEQINAFCGGAAIDDKDGWLSDCALKQAEAKESK